MKIFEKNMATGGQAAGAEQSTYRMTSARDDERRKPLKADYGRSEEGTTEEKKEEIKGELISEFEGLNRDEQHRVMELLDRMVTKNFGETPLAEAINEIGDELYMHEWWTGGKEVTDQRAESLSLLSRRDNGRAGRTFMVSEVKKILAGLMEHR